MNKIGSNYDQLEEALTAVEGDLAQVQAVLAQNHAQPAIEYNGGKLYTVGEAVVDVTDKGIVTTWQDANDFLNGYNTEQYLPFDPDEQFNKDFWQHPSELYHGTLQGRLDSIMKGGLNPRNETRGMSNRGTPSAVFTSTDWDEANHYYETVLKIDTEAMKAELPPTSLPFAGRESDIVEGEGKETLANALGYEDYSYDFEQGMSPNTVILYGAIPPKYLSIAKEDTNPSKRWHLGSKTAVRIPPPPSSDEEWSSIGPHAWKANFHIKAPEAKNGYIHYSAWLNQEVSPEPWLPIFHLPGKAYSFVFDNLDYRGPEGSFGVTGTGHTIEVGMKVGSLLLGVLRNLHPTMMYFSAKEGNRAVLYGRLTRLAAMSSGYIPYSASTSEGTYFILVSPESNEAYQSKVGDIAKPLMGKAASKTAGVGGKGWAIWQGKVLLNPTRSAHVDWFEDLGLPSSGPEFDRIPRGNYAIDHDTGQIFVWTDAETGSPTKQCWGNRCFDMEFAPPEVIAEIRKKHPEARYYEVYDEIRSGLRLHGSKNAAARLSIEEAERRSPDMVKGQTWLGNTAKYKFMCLKHPELGEYEQQYNNHAFGATGCKACIRQSTRPKLHLTIEESEQQSPDMVKGQIWNGTTDKYWFHCLENPEHKDYLQPYNRHLTGRSCPICGDKKRNKAKWYTIEEAENLCPDMVKGQEWRGIREEYQFTCPIHGEYSQVYDKHLHGHRCPICQQSHGEREIKTLLEALNLPFKLQYRIPECRDKKPLPFDFAVWIKGALKLIEFNGRQHYEARGQMKGRVLTEEVVSEIQRRDKIKLDFCSSHDIPLLVIPYWKMKDIKELVSKFLGVKNPIDKQASSEWWRRWRKTLLLKKGTILYHGTAQDFPADELRTPAWFSTSESVAEYFESWHGGEGEGQRILRFQVVKPIRLPRVDSIEDLDKLSDMFGFPRPQSGMDYADDLARVLPGWVIPHQYPDGDDILLSDSDSIRPMDEGVPEGREEPPQALGTTLERKDGAFQRVAFPRNQVIALQDALDRKLFGPVYHGTVPEAREAIDTEGFKVFEGEAATGPIRNGFEGNRGEYALGLPPPIHFLGYGVYFTTSKGVAKKFNGNSERGLKTYYLDVPRLETINFNASHTMMKWWLANGYPRDIAKADRVLGTKIMTMELRKKYDAVFHKGGGFRTIDMGPQVVVFDPSRIYLVDPNLAKPGDIGSKLVRKADGMKGTLISKRSIPQEIADQYWGGERNFLYVRWARGGADYNVLPSQVEFVQPKTAAGTAMWPPYEEWIDGFHPYLFNEAAERGDDNIEESEELRRLYDDFVRTFSSWKFPLTIWRAVKIGDIEGLETEGVGVAWSFRENMAIPYGGMGGETHVLRAKVPASSIDWDMTMELNLYGGEDEVRLIEGAPVQLEGYNIKGKWFPLKKRLTASNDRPISPLPALSFVKDARFTPSKYLLISVDTQKLDREWSKDIGFYLAPGSKENHIGDRYARFQTWLQEHPGAPIEAPFVSWKMYPTPETGGVGFLDGRHRFAVLRDMGYKTVSIVIEDKQLPYFKPLMTQKTAAEQSMSEKKV